jgi:hypothetical protein
MFYTYAHYTPQGRLFYIGKGQGKRAHRFYNRGAHWASVVAKHGQPKVEILADWKTEQEAFDHEILLIDCFKELGYKLCNQTNGGEGTSGLKLSEEHKTKISLAQKGKPGKKPSVETLAKLRTSHLGQKAWNKGIKGVYKQTPESIEKRVAKLRGHTHNVKFKYIGTDRATMETVEFVGNAAMKKAGFDPSRIRNCADGKRNSHRNYTWVKQPLGAKC